MWIKFIFPQEIFAYFRFPDYVSRIQKAKPYLCFETSKKLFCFDVGFDPGLPQAKQACRFSRLWYPVLPRVLLPHAGRCIRKYLCPSRFQGFFVVLSLTAGHGDTYGDVTFHPVETIEGSYCHTVETMLPRGFVNPQMCSRIFYKIQIRNTSLIRTFHSFKKHELLCARF